MCRDVAWYCARLRNKREQGKLESFGTAGSLGARMTPSSTPVLPRDRERFRIKGSACSRSGL